MTRWLLASNLATALLLTGLIWTIQLVHYPLMSAVGEDHFSNYESLHTFRITILVGPLMLAELAAAVMLVLRRPADVPSWAAWASLLLVGVVWTSTALLQVPRHSELQVSWNAASHAALVSTNWVRTWAWTARSILMTWACFRP